MTETTIDDFVEESNKNHDPSPRSVTESLKVIGYTLVHPRKAFEILRDRPYWIALFAVLSLATAFLAVEMKPYNVRAALTAFPADMPVSHRAELLKKWDNAHRTGLKLAPVLMLMKLTFGALVIWLLAIGAGKTERFSRALSVMTHAGLIVVVEAWFVFGTLAWRGLDSIRTPFDLQPSIGLNALFRPASVPLNALLGGINPFELWFVIVLAAGVSIVFQLRRAWAVAISVSYWAATLALQVGIAAIAALMAQGR